MKPADLIGVTVKGEAGDARVLGEPVEVDGTIEVLVAYNDSLAQFTLDAKANLADAVQRIEQYVSQVDDEADLMSVMGEVL